MPTAKRPYATGTKTQQETSIFQIQQLLRRAGAVDVTVSYSYGAGAVFCQLKNRLLKFSVVYPPENHAERMRKWRCLYATIKGRLLEWDEGLGVFEEIFLSHIVVNENGATVYETIAEKLPKADTLPALTGGAR